MIQHVAWQRHLCGYSRPAFLNSKGTRIVELSDPNNIVETALITMPRLLLNQ